MDELRALLTTAIGQASAFNLLDESGDDLAEQLVAAKTTAEQLKETLLQAHRLVKESAKGR